MNKYLHFYEFLCYTDDRIKTDRSSKRKAMQLKGKDNGIDSWKEVKAIEVRQSMFCFKAS